MFCNNCGNSLNGSENVCPNCGTPVQGNMPQMDQNDNGMNNNMPQMDNNANPEIINSVPQMDGNMNNNMPTPMNNDMNSMPQMNNDMNNMGMNNNMNGDMNNNMPQMNNGMNNMGMNNNMPTPMNNNQPKNNKNMTIILVAVLVGILVCGGVFVFLNKDNLFKKDVKEDTPTVETGNDSGSGDGVAVSSNSFNGYTFTIPEGYETQVTSDGFYFYNSSITYAIAMDFSHSFDDYYNDIAKANSSIAQQGLETVKNRKFFVVYGIDDEGDMVSNYLSPLTATSTYIGIIYRADQAVPGEAEYAVLADVLDSAKSASNFAPGDKVDAGKNGKLDANKPFLKHNFKK